MADKGTNRYLRGIFLRLVSALKRERGAFYAARYHRLSSVTQWTIFGPLLCVSIAWLATTLVFAGTSLPVETELRLAIATTSIPLLIATPLFLLFNRRMRRLAVTNLRLSQAVKIDSFTGCLNHGAFTAMVETYLRRAEPETAGALLIIDADHFKAINDAFGHDRGDDALLLIVASIRKIVRSGTYFGRLGGEEFGIFLPGSSRITAYLIGERIRRTVRQADFRPAGEPYQLGVSIGAASFTEAIGFAELYRAADQSLIAAKKAGRDRVFIAPAPRTIELRQRA